MEESLLGLGVVKENNLGCRMIPCRTRDDCTCLRFLQSSQKSDAFVQMLKLMEVNADDPLRTLLFLLLLKYTFKG